MNKGRAGAFGPAAYSPGGSAGLHDQDGLRRSHALVSLAKHFETGPAMQVLDLGGLNQQNLDFVTGYGNRLYAQEIVLGYEAFFTPEERLRGEAAAEKIEAFLRECLPFSNGALGAVLVWDRLQFLFPAAAAALVTRLKRLMAPGALLLALFHPEHLSSTAPLACRAGPDGAIKATPKPPARPAEPFNARAIEKLFSGFSGVKFYMTRDSLQEVLIRR
ncbi:MAG: hypothetical protein IH602_12395 [Bryobacteraceae bacterium]|nr:hypothetical protein [Bryobacteraceae bacterium]